MALHRLLDHLLATRNRGLVIQPDSKWDGGLDYLFGILGYLMPILLCILMTERVFQDGVFI